MKIPGVFTYNLSIANTLLKKGIYVVGFFYPVVPRGLARIRVQISALHTIENIDFLIDSFEEVGRELKVI